jgi:hypothetical protein
MEIEKERKGNWVKERKIGKMKEEDRDDRKQ